MPAEQHSESTNDTIEGFQLNKQEKLKGKNSTISANKQLVNENLKEGEEEKEENEIIHELHKPQEIFDCKYLPE